MLPHQNAAEFLDATPGERAAKRFYQEFQRLRAALLPLITGVPKLGGRYASVMLVRLMFLYFIQKKGFLNGEKKYLRNRFESRQDGSFYRDFLLQLFLCLNTPIKQRKPGLEKLLGRVPFLNASIFNIHPLEARHGQSIQISNPAFEAIFDCFDTYQWRLDEWPLLAGDEINPEVLGYILEKQINQKQAGAYYTKEDITEYIGRNTILPALFDVVRARQPSAFTGDHSIWLYLQEDPNAYLYPALGQDCERSGLPKETGPETIARRQRCADLRKKLAAGEVREIADFITLNLNFPRFACAVITRCDSAELLAAFWHALAGETALAILDPACGSGAFLFAALNILEPLYEACLGRMQSLVADGCATRATIQPENPLAEFESILNSAAAYPNQRYFIFRAIILNNLYGVDLMEEAVELCKLRFFLKLAAQVEPDAGAENLGFEPLPNLDSNFRAGNTLVGYSKFAKAHDRLADSEELREQLNVELHYCLAIEHGVKTNAASLRKWTQSHKPFHWCAEFPTILKRGGFDVIIGNPPYVKASEVQKTYSVIDFTTLSCPDIFAWMLERTESLLKNGGRTGMIVPLSLGFGRGFAPIRDLLYSRYGSNWFSSYGRIPSALFDARVRNLIHLGHKEPSQKALFTSRLHRWFDAERPHLFSTLQYTRFTPGPWGGRIPKLSTQALAMAFEELLLRSDQTLGAATSPLETEHLLYFKKTAYNWLNFCRCLPPCYKARSRVAHTQFGSIYFNSARDRDLALLLCNGNLMFVFWAVICDDFHVPHWSFKKFPINFDSLSATQTGALLALVPMLEAAMIEATQFKLNAGKKVGNYNLAKCRQVTSQSDAIFCEALGLAAIRNEIELYSAQIVKTDFSEHAK